MKTRRKISVIFVFFFTTAGLRHAHDQPPSFSQSINSVFPSMPGVTCLQGHAELPADEPQVWYIKAFESGTLSIGVGAVSINPRRQSGSFTAQLFDADDTLLGEITVTHPSGGAVEPGTECEVPITIQATASAVYRLEVRRGPATVAETTEASHYRLRLSGIPINLGIKSPSFHYLKKFRQVFHLNVDAGEDFRLDILVDDETAAGLLPQATRVGLQIFDRSIFPGQAPLLSLGNQTVSPNQPLMVNIPNSLASTGTLLLQIRTDGNYRMEKLSGSDRGIYFDVCPPPPLYLTQVGNGQGFASDIVLSNPSPFFPTFGRVRFFDDNGRPLPIGLASTPGESSSLTTGTLGSEGASVVRFSVPPLGTVTLKTNGEGNLVVGSAVVLANAILAGVVRWESQQGEQPALVFGGVVESEPLNDFIVPVRLTSEGVNTGVAFHNTETQEITLQVMLQTEAGEEIAREWITLPPDGHKARFIDEIFPDLEAFQEPTTMGDSQDPLVIGSLREDFRGTLVGQLLLPAVQQMAGPSSAPPGIAQIKPIGGFFAPPQFTVTALDVDPSGKFTGLAAKPLNTRDGTSNRFGVPNAIPLQDGVRPDSSPGRGGTATGSWSH